MRILIDDLSGPEIRELLEEHLASMYLHSPPESVHALPIERTAQAGDYVLDRLGEWRAAWLRSLERAERATRLDQVDANLCATPQKRSGHGACRLHCRFGQTSRLPQVEP